MGGVNRGAQGAALKPRVRPATSDNPLPVPPRLPGLRPAQCVPFVMPEHWASGAICEDLPGYTIHSEASMRQVGAPPSPV